MTAQRGKKLTPAQADELLDAVQEIMDQLETESVAPKGSNSRSSPHRGGNANAQRYEHALKDPGVDVPAAVSCASRDTGVTS